MCMFNEEVTGVSETKIFVGPVSMPHNQQSWQLTVYKNSVATKYLNEFGQQELSNENAMVLPFPVPKNIQNLKVDNSRFTVDGNSDIVRLLDMSKWETETNSNFFKSLERVFVDNSRSGVDQFFSNGKHANIKPIKLQVVKIGNYQISVSRSFDDLKFVDRAVFNLSHHLKQVLENHYSRGFGFLVCKFDSNIVTESNPVAYMHQLTNNGNYFVPCRHHHGTNKLESKYVDDWDHKIYVMNVGGRGFSSNESIENPFTKNEFEYLKKMVVEAGGRTINFKNIQKMEISGTEENKDFIISRK